MSDPRDAEIAALARSGRLLDAIEKYQAVHGVTVDAAEAAVSALVQGASDVVVIKGLDEATTAKVDALLRANKKIEAIKVLREATGLGLKESKELAEARAREQGIAMKAGCFVATAAFGDEDHEVVLALRRWRDERLLHSAPGRAFVRSYYEVSPGLARVVERSKALGLISRGALRVVARWVARGG